MTTQEVASATDEELSEVRKCIEGVRWEQLTCKQYIPVSSELCTIGHLVLRGTRIVAPMKLRPRLLALAHEGHLGIVGTKQKLRSESILVVVDYYSRYYEIDVLRSTITAKVITSLEEMFSRHGLPESLTSDNGPQFVASEFAAYMEQEGIRHHKTTAKWPQANGEVERQNRSILKRLKIAHAEKKDWRKELNTYLTAYRGLPHPTTGVSPAELLFGRKIRTRLPQLSDIHVEQGVRDRDAEQKARNKEYADMKRGATYSDVNIGDRVLVKQEKENKLTTTLNPEPYRVISKTGNSMLVESPDGAQYSRNSSHVKKFVSEATERAVEGNNGSDEGTEGTTSSKQPSGAEEIKQPYTPRPPRTRRLPSRLDDYVVTRH
ncbi:hypothetical protein QZH41_004075 [Actinostola sp. cb2023]|nr:hypothetical protein QZH41_004075 [Actinostola sp. cb2023]